MSIRLICLDLDGTTLRRDGTVSNRTLAALRRATAAGATGRIHGSAAPHGRRIRLHRPMRGLWTAGGVSKGSAVERFVLGEAAV